jgi:hypothetical protein
MLTQSFIPIPPLQGLEVNPGPSECWAGTQPLSYTPFPIFSKEKLFFEVLGFELRAVHFAKQVALQLEPLPLPSISFFLY